MLPLFFALAGLKVSTEAKFFMGWFGPRGLASIVFAVIVVNAHLPNSGPLAMTVAGTIILSIIAHGVSANAWPGGWVSACKEHRLVHPLQTHDSPYRFAGCRIGACGSGKL